MARKPTRDQARAVESFRAGYAPGPEGLPWVFNGRPPHFEDGAEPDGQWSVAFTPPGSVLTQLWRIERGGKVRQI